MKHALVFAEVEDLRDLGIEELHCSLYGWMLFCLLLGRAHACRTWFFYASGVSRSSGQQNELEPGGVLCTKSCTDDLFRLGTEDSAEDLLGACGLDAKLSACDGADRLGEFFRS